MNLGVDVRRARAGRAGVRRIVAALAVMVSLLGGVAASPASSAPPASFQELVEDPTLHRGHSEVLRLYYAVLDREPDVSGAQFWLNAYDSTQWTTRQIAAFFATSPEFVATYGPNVSNEAFVRIVYENVLDRAPEADGFQFWLGQVNGGMPRAEMILLISNSPEFINRIPLPGDARPSTGPVPRMTQQVLAYFDAATFYQGSPNPALAAPGSPAEDYANYVAAIEQLVVEDLDSFIIRPTSRAVTNTEIIYAPADSRYHNVRTEQGLVADFFVNDIQLGPAMGNRTDPVVIGDVTINRVVALQSGGSIALVFYIFNNGTSTVTVDAELATWSVDGRAFPALLGTDPIHTLAPGTGRAFVSIALLEDEEDVFKPGSVYLPMSDSNGAIDAIFDVG